MGLLADRAETAAHLYKQAIKAVDKLDRDIPRLMDKMFEDVYNSSIDEYKKSELADKINDLDLRFSDPTSLGELTPSEAKRAAASFEKLYKKISELK